MSENPGGYFLTHTVNVNNQLIIMHVQELLRVDT